MLLTHSSNLPASIPLALVTLTADSVSSDHSKRAYSAAVRDFYDWMASNPQEAASGFSRRTLQAWRTHLEASGLAASTINVRLAAVRSLAREATANGYLDQQTASGIAAVRGIPARGVRLGTWLTRAQAETLLSAPGTTTLRGLRDRALLAVLLGAGLRRSEVASLRVEHIRMVEARWCIMDLRGKGGRVRSVPMPSWCKAAIDAWTAAAGITSGTLFRALRRGGHLAGDSMTPEAIRQTVIEYGQQTGVAIAPHDLRRTFAHLAHKGHAALEQIQLSLGHASIQTTERYLGTKQNLADAPCDRLGIGS